MTSLSVLAVFSVLMASSDALDAIRAEPSLEKRAERALEYMDVALKEAQESQRQGAAPAVVLAKIEDSVAAAELSLQSLRETGKRPSKLTRQYKRGELRTRDALRKLEGLIQSLDFDQRAASEKPKARLQTVQDDYLAGVMNKS